MSESSDHLLDRLVELSRLYGSDPEVVLAGGGNTSVKAGERLFVKASGRALATIDRDGFVELDRPSLRSILAADLGASPEEREARFKERIHAARVHPGKGQRPSVECLLHEIVPSRWVVHSHPTIANALACSERGETLAREWFGDTVLWLPYVDPGFELAAALHAALAARSRGRAPDAPAAILMANHGLVIGGEEPGEVRARTRALLDRIRAELGPGWLSGAFGPRRAAPFPEGDAPPARRRLEEALRRVLAGEGEPFAVARDASELVLDFTGSEAGRAAASSGPLTPDQIVYCQSFPLRLDVPVTLPEGELDRELRAAARAHERATRFPPRVILAPGLGLFAIGETVSSAEAARALYVDAVKVMAGARRLGGIRHLDERQRRFIEDWEVEAYRREVARREARAPPDGG